MTLTRLYIFNELFKMIHHCKSERKRNIMVESETRILHICYIFVNN